MWSFPDFLSERASIVEGWVKIIFQKNWLISSLKNNQRVKIKSWDDPKTQTKVERNCQIILNLELNFVWIFENVLANPSVRATRRETSSKKEYWSDFWEFQFQIWKEEKLIHFIFQCGATQWTVKYEKANISIFWCNLYIIHVKHSFETIYTWRWLWPTLHCGP